MNPTKKIRWSMMPGGSAEVPADVIRLPSDVSRRHVRFGELRIDALTTSELEEILTALAPIGREVVLQCLLKAIEETRTLWQTRASAVEVVRRECYQPAIDSLTAAATRHQAYQGSMESQRVTIAAGSISETAALGTLRADRSLIKIAQAHLFEAPFILTNLQWTPTREARNAVVRSLPNSGLRTMLDALDAFDKPPRALRFRRPRQESIDGDFQPPPLGEVEERVWRSRFDFFVAPQTGPVCSPLDFGQGIVSIRDALLVRRRALDPMEQMSTIQQIDRVMVGAVDGLNLLCEIGMSIVRERATG